jgi:hypothetical protein
MKLIYRRSVTRHASVIIQFIVVFYALVAVSTFVAAQQTETLRSVKQRYLNQRVVLIGNVTDKLASQPVLMQWNLGIESAGRYNTDWESFLPATYKGKTATVIAIQLNNLLEKQGKVNALGEQINADDAVDPYFDIVVRFDDGQIAMNTAYSSTLSDEVRLSGAQNVVAQEMAEKLPGVVGRIFYGCSYTSLYSTDATVDELLGPYAGIKRISFPYLTPLKVTAAKFNEGADAVVMKVKLPDGRDALTIATGEQLTEKDETFIDRISGSLLSEIPKKLTLQEIAAIRKESIFRGMSMDAVYCSVGLPHTENDWGSGGKQFVYDDGMMVYLNNQNSVVDWQMLGK